MLRWLRAPEEVVPQAAKQARFLLARRCWFEAPVAGRFFVIF